MAIDLRARRITNGLLALLLSAFVVPLLADGAPPDKSDFTLFNPTPDADLRSFSTDRPPKANSPYTADTGHGISPEHIQRIYDPFFTTKGSRKGPGMGLAVTYGIVQEHKGSIEVSSRQGGTRFQLRLPWSRTAVGQASGLSASNQPVNAA